MLEVCICLKDTEIKFLDRKIIFHCGQLYNLYMDNDGGYYYQGYEIVKGFGHINVYVPCMVKLPDNNFIFDEIV